MPDQTGPEAGGGRRRDDAPLRHRLVALATGTYEAFPPLPVAPEVETVRSWLCDDRLGRHRTFRHDLPGLAQDPSQAEVLAALRNPGPTWTADDAVFLFVTGHGVVDDGLSGQHVTVLADTDPEALGRTGIVTSELVTWVAETPVRHLFLVLDVCYAAAVADGVARFLHGRPDSWFVLPGAGRDEEVEALALTGAIGEFVRRLRSERDGDRYGFAREHLTPGEFMDAVEEILDEHGHRVTLRPLAGRADRLHHCLPNPRHREAAGVPVEPSRRDLALPWADLERHWDPRSRGVRDRDEPGWLFSGRAALVRRLIDAVTGPPGSTIVSGAAGSGKSALLARVVTLSDSRFRESTTYDLGDVPPNLLPPIGSVDVAVVATGKTPLDVFAQLCTGLGVPEPAEAGGPLLVDRIRTWQEWVTRPDAPTVTVVIDAIEEAANPNAVVEEVVGHLQPPGAPRVRVVVGIRSARAAVPARPVEPGHLSLADSAARLLGAEPLRIDDDAWWDDADLETYARDILRFTPGSPYADVPAAALLSVVEAVRRHADRSFLFAGLAARSLARRDRVVPPDDPDWLGSLADGVVGVLREDLRRTLPEPDRERAVTLLRALAVGRGRGLPWRHVWPRVATAVGGVTCTDADVAWLLDGPAAGYVTTDVEDGVVVYRLFHEQLRDTLYGQWRLLTGEGT